MLLKPNELADLKTMAASNLDAALFSAARIGMNINIDAKKAMEKASLIIDYEAETRRERMIANKEWDDDEEIRKVYAEYKFIVKKLREVIECLNKEAA